MLGAGNDRRDTRYSGFSAKKLEQMMEEAQGKLLEAVGNINTATSLSLDQEVRKWIAVVNKQKWIVDLITSEMQHRMKKN